MVPHSQQMGNEGRDAGRACSLVLVGEAALEVARRAQHRHHGAHAVVVVVLHIITSCANDT